MTIFFTADNHFGHDKIRGYCERPFKTIADMDYELIRRWNSVVKPTDVVYHLGDFTLQDDASQYFCQLNGYIHILYNPWHHDKRWIKKRALSTVQEARYVSKSGHPIVACDPLIVLELEECPPIVLCHYPIARWDRAHYGAWHLHGHCHGRYQGEGYIYDVGVDNNNFYPVSLAQIEEIMLGKGWYSGWKQYG